MARRPHNAELIVEARSLLMDILQIAVNVPDGWGDQVRDFLARTERFERRTEEFQPEEKPVSNDLWTLAERAVEREVCPQDHEEFLRRLPRRPDWQEWIRERVREYLTVLGEDANVRL